MVIKDDVLIKGDDVAEFIVPSSVKEIKGYSCSSFRNLENVFISDSVEHIGFDAFFNCEKLKVVYCNNKSFKEYFSKDILFLPIKNSWVLSY